MDISAQKYKIWINASWMIFMTPGQFKKMDFKGIPMFCLLQSPSIAEISDFMNKLWFGHFSFPVIITSRDVAKTWKKLFKKTPIVYAAGGIVKRPDGKYLFIKRRGWWDLPKGKLDDNEKTRQAALREVKEEVGLDSKILYSLPDTYHCYTIKDMLVIKITSWYVMNTKQTRPKLQYEEDITESRWVSRPDFDKMKPRVYANLRGLIDAVRKE